jgi:hypothetical protein
LPQKFTKISQIAKRDRVFKRNAAAFGRVMQAFLVFSQALCVGKRAHQKELTPKIGCAFNGMALSDWGLKIHFHI